MESQGKDFFQANLNGIAFLKSFVFTSIVNHFAENLTLGLWAGYTQTPVLSYFEQLQNGNDNSHCQDSVICNHCLSNTTEQRAKRNPLSLSSSCIRIAYQF